MPGVVERVAEAQNAHDADLVASYVTEDYRSEQPNHPARAFAGRERVLTNWTAVFAAVPDFHAEVLTVARTGDTEWAEPAWRGRHVDGSDVALARRGAGRGSATA